MSGRLTREELAIAPEQLAPRLLGAVLVRVLDDGTRLSGVIVETEAYLGAPDRAAHSFAGRRTPRVEPMYGPAGTAYVYFTYGMHHCCNVVCGAAGEPVAVLLRALEPGEGIGPMSEARAARTGRRLREHDLCSGPAKLCEAMSIDRSLSGSDLITGASLWLERGERAGRPILRGPRIGVAYAGAWAERPLRFWFADSRHVSAVRKGEYFHLL